MYKRAVIFDQFLKCLFFLALKVCFRWRVLLVSAASESEFRNLRAARLTLLEADGVLITSGSGKVCRNQR